MLHAGQATYKLTRRHTLAWHNPARRIRPRYVVGMKERVGEVGTARVLRLLSSDELRAFLEKGTIALDANVLLALYRVGEDQRNQILDVLAKVADRVFVPYQAALEYQRNRLKVVSDQLKAHQKVAAIAGDKAAVTLADAIAALRQMSEEAQKDIRDPDVKKSVGAEFEQTITDLDALAAKAKDRMTSRLERLRAQHTISFETARTNDPVRGALDSLLSDERVGDPTDHSTRRADAMKRLADGLPPGGKDKDKEDPSGDGIIWLELISHSKSMGRPLLFVTDDEKEDWYRRTRGQIIGPLTELRVEMTAATSQPYHQTTLDGFLRRLAKTFLSAQVSEDTIESIRTRRKAESTKRKRPCCSQMYARVSTFTGRFDRSPSLSDLIPLLVNRWARVRE